MKVTLTSDDMRRVLAKAAVEAANRAGAPYHFSERITLEGLEGLRVTAELLDGSECRIVLSVIYGPHRQRPPEAVDFAPLKPARDVLAELDEYRGRLELLEERVGKLGAEVLPGGLFKDPRSLVERVAGLEEVYRSGARET